MRSLLKFLFIFIAGGGVIWSCTGTTEKMSAHQSSIYHWKTLFSPDSAEMAFIEKHSIGRIYLRMFDVALETNQWTRKQEIVPIATTRFESSIPKGVEIVPVTYITLEALRAMSGQEREYAELITDRLLAMCSHNECGNIREVQFDCDWTATTKGIYSSLCQHTKNLLSDKGIDLSITVRLHQLGENPPPADKGVLMLYNTGALKEFRTKNSILDLNDVKPYLMKKATYPIPLDYSYPIFGWGVKFHGENFISIVSERDSVKSEKEVIRYERPSYPQIESVKRLVEKNLGKPAHGNILYHLESEHIKHYSDEEIAQILAH